MSQCRALFPWLPFAVALRSVTNVRPRQARGSAACHLWARQGQAPENCPVSLSLNADRAGSWPDNAGREGTLQPDSADPTEPRQPETTERERSQPESRAAAWCPVTWLPQRSQGTLTEGSKLHVGQAVTADRGGSGRTEKPRSHFRQPSLLQNHTAGPCGLKSLFPKMPEGQTAAYGPSAAREHPPKNSQGYSSLNSSPNPTHSSGTNKGAVLNDGVGPRSSTPKPSFSPSAPGHSSTSSMP